MSVNFTSTNHAKVPTVDAKEILQNARKNHPDLLGQGKYITDSFMQKDTSKYADPVHKGTVIGAGISAIGSGLALLAANTIAKSGGFDLVKDIIKPCYGSTKKYAALVAAEIGLAGLIGAGIGKLVKNHREKVALKEQVAANTATLEKQGGDIPLTKEEIEALKDAGKAK